MLVGSVGGDKVVGSRSAVASLNNVELYFLAFAQPTEAGCFNRRYMYEDVISSIVWNDKSEPLCRVKPLYFACTHSRLYSRLVQKT